MDPAPQNAKDAAAHLLAKHPRKNRVTVYDPDTTPPTVYVFGRHPDGPVLLQSFKDDPAQARDDRPMGHG